MKSNNAKVTQLVIAGLCFAAATFGAQAQIMKCVGKDGKIEFASSCPSGTKQQDTGVGNKPAAAPAPAAKSDAKPDGKEAAKAKPDAPKSLADRDAEYRKRQAEQKAADTKAAQTATDNEDRQRACRAAQNNLAAIKNRQRMFTTDPKTGERVMYEEADYQREAAITERLAAENCKG
jgi:hypothetical protein